MSDFLVNHALQNVWCSPDQDKQFIFQPARLSPRRGVERQTIVEWQTLTLPDAVSTFHVYQIGQIDPRQLGMTLERGKWHNLASVCNNDILIADLYDRTGVQYPRFTTWVRYMNDRNVILAVKLHEKVGDLEHRDLFVRFYSNAFYETARVDLSPHRVWVEGLEAKTQDEILLLQRRLIDLRKQNGVTLCFRNGFMVDDIPPNRAAPGDIIELVQDTTVKEVVDLPVNALSTFDSELDLKRKYLLHPPGKGEIIEYRDDVDMFLIDKTGQGHNGVFLHKNQEDALRMVTHRDYSVPVAYLTGYVLNHPHWSDLEALTIRLYVRHSGYERPLVHEHHRIHELYKLEDAEIEAAMLGLHSTVSVWRAPALEKSQYPQIMRSLRHQITRGMVEDAYGYNAISKLLGDSPLRPVWEQSQKLVDLPAALREESTIYEYNANGHLLGHHVHPVGAQYVAQHIDCELVEGIVGKGGTTLTTNYGDAVVPIDERYNHRFYVCDVVGLQPTYEWRDVTDSDLYEIIDGEVVWYIDMEATYPAVKNDREFLAYTYLVAMDEGVIRFSITAIENRGGTLAQLPLTIPVGQLELWLNGRPLIENLDYIVKWPEVVICNKEYLVDGTQAVTVRGTGFCRADMSREPVPEVGFVRHGQLSRNDRFNVREDKVMRYVVNGAIRHPDELSFAEETLLPVVGGVRNGAPYAIRDVVVPIRGLGTQNAYRLREMSQGVDREVEDYLTLHHPESEITDTLIIPELYQVFSPFISKIHKDLEDGWFYPDGIEGQYSEMDLREWLKDYEYLLAYDPAIQGVNPDFVAIHPHERYTVSELNIYQYTLLERAIKVYLDDKVDLTAFTTIKQGWI